MHSNGYRVINEAGKMVYLHRRAWEEAHGPIPPGMVIHHVCEQKGCINVDHLQLVTKREHGVIHRRVITTCPRCGSERTPIRTRPGKTYCAPCAAERSRARAAAKGWPPHKDHRIGAPLIECGCGCGKLIPRLRSDGKPATFAHGHNPR